jgi:hypothetical protein
MSKKSGASSKKSGSMPKKSYPPAVSLRMELGEDEAKRLRKEAQRLNMEIDILKKRRRTSRRTRYKRGRSEVRLDRQTQREFEFRSSCWRSSCWRSS